ncbi:TPA: penicillin-binding transpeptidase domain-containing protein, partial [Streptococcus suis]
SAEGGLGELIEKKTSTELNKVAISEQELAILQQGFYQVANGSGSFNTGHQISNGAAVSISAKTGTAETFTTDRNGQVISAVNTNIVAYAPSANPKIAVAVVLPNLTDFNSTASMTIVTEIINLYNSLYPMN